jgi:hypothetical protein
VKQDGDVGSYLQLHVLASLTLNTHYYKAGTGTRGQGNTRHCSFKMRNAGSGPREAIISILKEQEIREDDIS